MPQSSPPGGPEAIEHDAIIVGAGFTGLYAIHELREKLGLSVQAFERGDGVGGTWYWNRYPGARCDVESLDYSYSFSPELEQEWEWTERYPAQPEIERYLNHVADRFDLRRSIQFSTTVASATWEEDSGRWLVETGSGDRHRAQFLVLGVGCLSSRLDPRDMFEGVDSFAGDWYHTGSWPKDGVDFTGKRVGVIGTGSTGIQLIPQAAETAERVFTFQRTPNYSVPAQNRPMDQGYANDLKARYRDHRAAARLSPFGQIVKVGEVNQGPALAVSEEIRRGEFEKAWERGGGVAMLLAFGDLLADLDANDTVSEFVRSKIREIVTNPEVAAQLSPTDYPLGAKRICVDTDYYKTYNRENVELVPVRENRIRRLTPAGIELEDGTEIELDIVVFAIGYDAMTGALLDIDIRGRGGESLREHWVDGPRTYLGLVAPGFPNMFMVTGPQSPSVLTNMVVSIEQHVDWLADAIRHMREAGIVTIEATAAGQDAWVKHVNEVGSLTLFAGGDSWYTGANVPGKPRIFMPYAGGLGNYWGIIQNVAAEGYEGFLLDGVETPLGSASEPFLTPILTEAEPAAEPAP
jgi:cyclohexanone monooxygenase